MTSLSTIAYQMQVLSMANNCNSSLPPPPESLNSSFTTSSSEETYPFELDCTGFIDNTSLSSSYNSMMQSSSQASSSLSQASHQSSMKRSHFHTNLSSLGSSVSSADLGVMSLSNTRRMPSSRNDGWGYFADTTARWTWCAADSRSRRTFSGMLWCGGVEWSTPSAYDMHQVPPASRRELQSSRDHVLSSPPYAMQWYLLSQRPTEALFNKKTYDAVHILCPWGSCLSRMTPRVIGKELCISSPILL